LVNFRASDGWIRNFKKRHGIDERVLHGEAGSADQVYVEIAEAGLPKILHGVDYNDVYNMDETGLRSLPTLASQPHKGIKEAKDRITAVLCSNATDTHKFKTMIIVNAAKPRSFVKTYDPLRDDKIIYDHTKKSWMDCEAFVSWITHFNDEMLDMGMTGWLHMDNCSTQCISPDAEGCVWDADGLKFRGFKKRNTNIIFSPPNVTSLKQPNDRGIIRAFKAWVRKFQIRWVLDELELGNVARSDQAKPNVRQAIEWSRQAWESLSLQTIQNCWKSANSYGCGSCYWAGARHHQRVVRHALVAGASR
jgi:hypothetical protein